MELAERDEEPGRSQPVLGNGDRDQDELHRMRLRDFMAEIRGGARCVWCGRRFGPLPPVSSQQIGLIDDVDGAQIEVYACAPSCYRPRPP